MSHTTTLKTIEIRDMDAVKNAVAELVSKGIDCTIEYKAKPGMYYRNQEGQCDFVLRLPGAKGHGHEGRTQYDIGFRLQADGSYAMLFDDFDNALRKVIGASCPMPSSPEGKAQHAIAQFTQLYGKHAAINAAIAQGYQVESAEYDEKGDLQLSIAV